MDNLGVTQELNLCSSSLLHRPNKSHVLAVVTSGSEFSCSTTPGQDRPGVVFFKLRLPHFFRQKDVNVADIQFIKILKTFWNGT